MIYYNTLPYTRAFDHQLEVSNICNFIASAVVLLKWVWQDLDIELQFASGQLLNLFLLYFHGRALNCHKLSFYLGKKMKVL